MVCDIQAIDDFYGEIPSVYDTMMDDLSDTDLNQRYLRGKGLTWIIESAL